MFSFVPESAKPIIETNLGKASPSASLLAPSIESKTQENEDVTKKPVRKTQKSANVGDAIEEVLKEKPQEKPQDKTLYCSNIPHL